MKKTLFLALAASTAVLAGCGSADTAASPVAPVAAPQAGSAPATTQAAPSGTTRPAALSDPGAQVDADDQSGDGTTVVVREARITVGPGWLAIRSDDDDRGRLLGSAPIEPGQTGPITVTLTEPVPTGDDDDDLTVVLHADDGDGAFDEQLDPRVLDDDDDDDDDGDEDDIEDDDFDYRVG